MEIIDNRQDDGVLANKTSHSVGKEKTVHEITDLRSALRNKERVNVFIDGKFAFSLTIPEIVDYKLKIGVKLNDEQLAELESVSEFGKLYEKAVMWALMRPHSEKEAFEYLENKRRKREIEWKKYEQFEKRLKEDPEYRQKVKEIREKTREKNENMKQKDFTEDNRGEYVRYFKTGLPSKPASRFSREVVENLVEKLRANRVVDDESFARFFVNSKISKKGISRKKLVLELRQKGVSDDIINLTLSNSEVSEEDEIKKMIAKKQSKYPDKQKLISYLCRQGFDYSLVQNLVREMDSQNLE